MEKEAVRATPGSFGKNILPQWTFQQSLTEYAEPQRERPLDWREANPEEITWPNFSPQKIRPKAWFLSSITLRTLRARAIPRGFVRGRAGERNWCFYGSSLSLDKRREKGFRNVPASIDPSALHRSLRDMGVHRTEKTHFFHERVRPWGRGQAVARIE